MKQRLFLIFMALLILTLNSHLVLGGEIILIPYYKFEFIDNGKPSGVKGIAEIKIYDLGDKFLAQWRGVLVEPVENSKQIRLSNSTYTTENGSISNVEVDGNHFSFIVENRFNIVGKKKKSAEGYDISGIGLICDLILNDTIKREMRTIDKIILPYNEVYP
jgi:hypothetical protein